MLIIDHVEANIAVCETADGSIVKVNALLFKPEAYEGGCYEEADDCFIYNEEETVRRREENAALFAELFGEEAIEE